MRNDELQIEINLLRNTLLPELKGKLFHVTSYQAFERIIKNGDIKVNDSGVPRWPTFTKSYASSRDLICLFDLRRASDERINYALKKIDFLNPPHCKEKPVFLFFKKTIAPKIISCNEVGHNEQYVPYIEAWHPSPLSIENVDRILKVNIILDEDSQHRENLADALGE